MHMNKRKALQLYCKLILNRIEEPISIKNKTTTELHHIIPRCVVPWKPLSKSKYNLIRLYSHEHFLAHYYLTFIFPHNAGVHQAFYLMCNIRNSHKYRSIEKLAQAYQTSKQAVVKRRKNKTYAQLYGNKRSISVKIKQKQTKMKKYH